MSQDIVHELKNFLNRDVTICRDNARSSKIILVDLNDGITTQVLDGKELAVYRVSISTNNNYYREELGVCRKKSTENCAKDIFKSLKITMSGFR